MDYSSYEDSALAFCLYYPDFLSRLDSDLLLSERNMIIYMSATEIHRQDMAVTISYDILETYLGNSSDPKIVDAGMNLIDIYSHVNNFMNSDKVANMQSYLMVTRLLEERKKRIALLKDLEEASHQIRDGDVEGGLRIARQLKYFNPVKLPSTETLMTDSIIETNGFATGINAFDDAGGLLKGNIFALTGDTGMQKTMASLWVILQTLVHNPGYTALYFEKEMPIKDLAKRLVARLLQVDSLELKKIALIQNKEERQAKEHAILERIKNKMSAKEIIANAISRIKLIPNNYFRNSYDIIKLIEQEQPEIACLDFLTMLESDTKDFYQFILGEMNRLKEASVQNDALIMILSQLKHNTVEGRANKIPTMSDMEWGTKLKQLAAYAYTCFWPFKYGSPGAQDNWFYLIGLKHRDANAPTVFLKTSPQYSSFSEMDHDSSSQASQWLTQYKNPQRDSLKF